MPLPSPPSEWPPRTLLRIPLGYVPRDPNQVLLLTEEQIEVARRLGMAHRALLDGATGSGKTHLAAAVAAGYARMGHKVLYLVPRKPLALWLQRALQPLGVSVMTIGDCAREVYLFAGKSVPVRKGFDDPGYFHAAGALAKAGRWHLVIGDEWQTTLPAEQLFAQSVAARSRFIEVRDSSRELRGGRGAPSITENRLELTACMRSAEPVARLDFAYANDGIEPLPPAGST